MYMQILCIHLHDDDIIVPDGADGVLVTGEEGLELAIVGLKHTQL